MESLTKEQYLKEKSGPFYTLHFSTRGYTYEKYLSDAVHLYTQECSPMRVGVLVNQENLYDLMQRLKDNCNVEYGFTIEVYHTCKDSNADLQ